MGRLFDAVSALVGVCEKSSYEAQAAIELQQSAQSYTMSSAYNLDKVQPYPFRIDASLPVKQLRVAALFDALLSDLEHRIPVPVISTRFHLTVVEMITQLCDLIRHETDIQNVALSGGVFQNGLLMESLVSRLTSRGLKVLIHRQVPCNDGGVSLGQAAMAGVASIR
jgi:hydrogenase maturation protein HypF